MTFTIAPEDSEGTILGKAVSDLQSGITFTDDGVYGTLKYVTGYTGFSGDPAEQEGHYLAFKVETDDEDDVITMELLGGKTGHPVTLDSDRNAVIHVGDVRKQKLRIIVTHTETDDNDETVTSTETKIYRMADLTLEEE